MENVREHINFELVDTPERFQKCVNNPTYKHRHIINENLVGVEKLKETVKLSKPIYVGMSILDLSKLHMYSFNYDVLKHKYKEDIKLIYTDTDSFVIHTKTEDIYDDFKELSEHMDFSGYNKNHKCYDPTNKKVLGKFKDECDGKIIAHFIGLKPKSYAFKVYKEDKEEKKSKGIVKHKVKKELTFKKYKQTLETTQSDKVSFNSIRSKNHQIYTINQIKQSLSRYDNKRYCLDSVSSFPFGHFSYKIIQKGLKDKTPYIMRNLTMEDKALKKVKAFVKKNPFPSYEFIGNMLLEKANRWKQQGGMELKFHYLWMNSEYGKYNHKKLKEIYEDIENDEFIKKNGSSINKHGTQTTLKYNHFAMCEILQHLIKDQNLNNANAIYHNIKLRVENNWQEFQEFLE